MTVLQLTAVLARLKKSYGSVRLAEPHSPFELIVWENVAYLTGDDVRGRVYAALDTAIGIDPVKLAAAGTDRIARVIAGGGMQPAHRAQKVRRCAEIALSVGNNLSGTLSWPLTKARTLLKRFPGISDPGADKILLLCGYDDVPALESNGLRVLQRLGFVANDASYARMYKAATAVLAKSNADYVSAFALLRAHGRELCKRNDPMCPACPLRKSCPSSSA